MARMQQRITRPGAHLDHLTPSCHFCCEEHVGMHQDTALLLTGAFAYNPDTGTAMFILSPDTDVGFVQLANGQMAIVADAGKGVAAVHAECVSSVLHELGAEDDDLEDIDDDVEEVDMGDL